VAWQDGELHQGRKKRLPLCCCQQSFQGGKCQPNAASHARLQLIQLVQTAGISYRYEKTAG